MSKPKTEAQRQPRLAAKRRRQGLMRERIRRGELVDHLCRVCKTAPVYVRGGRCKACYLKQGQARSQRGGRPRYVCYVCTSAAVSGLRRRCRSCYLKEDQKLVAAHAPRTEPARTTTEILVHDANLLRSKNVARRDRDPEKYMEVAQDEYWALPSQCQSCRKRIIWAGLCYACATKRPRRLLRASERTEVLV